MKRTLRYALTAVLGAALVVPAMAQDNFPDVPDNHWAYQALENMKKEGILVGYPDGLFRGPRPASRYEMAVAINAAYQKLKSMYSGLDDQIKALQEKVDGLSGLPGEVKDLRDQLAALKATVDGMQSWKDDIDNLKKLAEKFEKELASLGVDVEALKKDLSDLEARVTALEKRKPAVDISGDVNLLALSGHGNDDTEFGMTTSGRLTGVGRDGYAGQVVGMTRDLSILHEGAFTFKGTNDEGPKWRATLVVGNMLSGINGGVVPTTALGNQSQLPLGTGFREGSADVYFQDFVVSMDTSIGGLNFSADIGRLGYQISPYLLQRPDYTPYFDNDRWDNGDYYFDGALLKFKFGAANLHLFGGRNSDRRSVNGVEINPLTSGVNRFSSDDDGNNIGIDQSFGARLNFPIGDMGSINLAYLWLDTNSPSTFNGVDWNRSNVYGGDINLKWENLMFNGGFAKSDYSYNTSKVLDSENDAWWAKLAYNASNWGIEGGYRNIKPNFGAPGNWGRLGVAWNPTNIEGFHVGAHINVTPEFRISASGEFYKGSTSSVGNWLTEDDNLNSFIGQIDYKLNQNWSLMASYEDVVLDSDAIGVPDITQRWFTFGLGYNMGANAKWSIMYQTSDLKNLSLLSNNFADRYRGGLLSTQVSIKF
ncbi:MAG: S-layer homology domain-containing protein [Fimbriimonadaceae bacterium]|nr:S-layer homology domain-containing protein [Fimbriimonadaceae bacterium]